MKILIAYDITDDKRRRRVYKILKNYAQRVQYSLFESQLSKKELSMLEIKLKQQIDCNEDNIRIYSICSSCQSKFKELGKVVENNLERDYLIV